jgi:predicted nucleic acid-binding protein
VIALDSSVAIRAFVAGYEDHGAARMLVAKKPGLPSHAALETYSVLTRFPEPYRVDPLSAAELIADAFGARLLPGPSARSLAGWLRRMADGGVVGGAIYDALIAETARAAGATLVTADRRAAATYRAVGVDVEILGD